MRRILSVKIKWMNDDDPDLSFLGKYTNTPGEGAIDRMARGNWGRGQYKWFQPAMTGEETGNPDSPEEDYQRMEAHSRGDWWMVGCEAVAEVILSGSTIQKIRGGGLWGVESDCGEEYRKEIEDGQLAELSLQLAACKFTEKEIQAAFKEVERVEV